MKRGKLDRIMARLDKELLEVQKRVERTNKKTDLYQKHIFAGDRHYKGCAYEKAIKEWRIGKRIYTGAGYPYQQLPKAYRKLATSNFKEGKYKAALKWYRELEGLVKEAEGLVRQGKALSVALSNLKLGPRDEKQIRAIYLKLGIHKDKDKKRD